MLQYAGFAGPAGPAFSFSALSPLSLNHLSEWRRNQFSLRRGCPLPPDSRTTGSPGPNGASLVPCWCRSPTRLSKPHTGSHRPSLVFSPQDELTPPPKGGGAGITHLSWIGQVGFVRSKLDHAGSTGPTLFLAGVVPLPGLQNCTRGHTGPSLVFTVFFSHLFSVASQPAAAPGGN